MSIASNYTNLLLKKYIGTPESSTSLSYANEAAGSSRPFVINSQLYNQTIPIPAPTTPTETNAVLTSASADMTQTYYINANGKFQTVETGSYGTLYTSTTYPWIQFIQNLKLSNVVPQTSYRFFNPASTTGNNLLQNAIPFNYDIVQSSYKYTLTVENSTAYPQGSPTASTTIDPQYYILDIDAGYLMFVNGDYNESVYGQPLISFYRYNGTTGTTNYQPLISTTATNASGTVINLSALSSSVGALIYNTPVTSGTTTFSFTGGSPNGSYVIYIPGCTAGSITFSSSTTPKNIYSATTLPYAITLASGTTSGTVIMCVTMYANLYYVSLAMYNGPY